MSNFQVTMAARFCVREVPSMCYSSDFSLSGDDSSCDEGEKIAALSRAVTSEPLASGSSSSSEQSSEPIASGSRSTSVDRLFVSANVSTDTEEDQGQFHGE